MVVSNCQCYNLGSIIAIDVMGTDTLRDVSHVNPFPNTFNGGKNKMLTRFNTGKAQMKKYIL